METNNYILVTGGAGYIGSHTVKELVKKNYKIIILDNLENGLKSALNNNAEFVECDLRNKDELSKVFNKYQPEAVIHFAAYASVPDSVKDPAKYLINNIIGGINLLECMRENNVNKIVFSSSAAIFGEPERSPIKEDDNKKPTNPYGLTKLQFEQYLQAYDVAYGIKSVSLRYFCAAGADPDGELGENHNPETHVIPMAILTALGKRPEFKIFGDDYPTPDGTGVRDFIHVTDLGNIHILALEYLQNGGNTTAYNCGNEKGFSVKEIVETVKKISGKDFTTKIEPRRAGDPAILVADSTKLQQELGFKSQFSDIDTIVKTSYKWFESK